MVAFVALLLLGGNYTVRRVGLIGAAVTGAVFVLLLAIFIGRLADLGATDEAIMMASVATVKNAPDPKSSDAFVLHSGVKLWVIDRVSEWVKIRLADGKTGLGGAQLDRSDLAGAPGVSGRCTSFTAVSARDRCRTSAR